MSHILITGAAGMIGSHLCDKFLEEGHTVIGIDDLSFGNIDNLKNALTHENFNFKNIKVEDLSPQDCRDHYAGLFGLRSLDFIYHLASYKKATKESLLSSNEVIFGNIGMINNIIALSKLYNSKIIFTSTSDVYGNSDTFSEDDSITIGPTTIPRYSYAMSKLIIEQILLNSYADGKINISIARIFGCFSERSNKSWSGGHIPLFIDKCLNNEPIEIHGDGTQTRSMTYVSDIINGLYQIYLNFDDCNGEIINLGTDWEMSVIESAKIIKQLSGSNSEIKLLPGYHGKYKEIQRRFANTKKAQKLFGFRCKTDILESLQYVINEWKNDRK